MAFSFGSTLLHFSLSPSPFPDLPNFRLRLEPVMQANPLIRHLVPCRPRCSSAPTEMIPFSTMLEPRRSTLPLWTFLPRPSFASHCSTTAQLMCDTATTLVESFSVRRAFQGEATV